MCSNKRTVPNGVFFNVFAVVVVLNTYMYGQACVQLERTTMRRRMRERESEKGAYVASYQVRSSSFLTVNFWLLSE